MRLAVLAAALALAATGQASAASKTQCRDAKGHFAACPAPAAKQTCKDAKGHFAKCGAPGAKPV